MVSYSVKRRVRVIGIVIGILIIVMGFVLFPTIRSVMSMSGMFEVTREFVVPAGTEHHKLHWNAPRAGEKFYGHFMVAGGNNDIKFSITDPSGKTIYDAGLVEGRHDFSFEATEKGVHEFHFDNRFSTDSKSIKCVGEISLLHEQLWVEPFVIMFFVAVGIIVILVSVFGRK